QDAHPEPGWPGRHPGGRHDGHDPGRRHLCCARTRRDRRLGVDRATRRHAAGPAPDGPVLLLPGLARAGHRERLRLQQESLWRPARRAASHARPCCRGHAGVRARELQHKEHDRARGAQDGVQGQGRARPAPGSCPTRSQEDCGRRHQGAVREDAHGAKGARVLHQVSGAGGPVGPRGRGRLPPADRGDIMIERRRFLANAGGVMAAAAAAPFVDAPAVIAQPKIQWRLSTAWPPALKLMHGSAVRLAKNVEELSGGRFRIEVFAGDQIVPAFGAFEATSQGKIEAFMGAPSYWADNEPAIEWFQSVPFGMNPEGMAAWYYHADGLKLWQETYAPYNLVPPQGP